MTVVDHAPSNQAHVVCTRCGAYVPAVAAVQRFHDAWHDAQQAQADLVTALAQAATTPPALPNPDTEDHR